MATVSRKFATTSTQFEPGTISFPLRLVHFPPGDHEDLAAVWLWSDRDGSAGQQPLPIACTWPEMPQFQDLLERQGACLLDPGK